MSGQGIVAGIRKGIESTSHARDDWGRVLDALESGKELKVIYCPRWRNIHEFTWNPERN